jgi:hypothetical protein
MRVRPMREAVGKDPGDVAHCLVKPSFTSGAATIAAPRAAAAARERRAPSEGSPSAA